MPDLIHLLVSPYNNSDHMTAVRLMAVASACLEGRKYDKSAV
jgi:hypothetical protein